MKNDTDPTLKIKNITVVYKFLSIITTFFITIDMMFHFILGMTDKLTNLLENFHIFLTLPNEAVGCLRLLLMAIPVVLYGYLVKKTTSKKEIKIYLLIHIGTLVAFVLIPQLLYALFF